MKIYCKRFTTILLMMVFSLSAVQICMAQEEPVEEIEPYMEFSYWKNTLNQKVLRVKMSYFTDIAQKPIEDLEILFYTNEDDPVLIGSGITDNKGLLNFVVPDSVEIPLNADGMMYFYAEYEGTEAILPALEEVWAQDVNLEMVLEQKEGERQVHLYATTTVDGETVPVSGEDVYVYVPRMFSDLQVGEGYFEEDGSTMVEFPSDIPGDSLGNLTIIARFNDHYLYGNVEKREDAPWGIPSYHEGPGDVRALWTQVAPKWMIITLTILLVGVWGHYLYTIISIIRISKNGKTGPESA